MDINLSFATVASRLQMAPKELRAALRAEVQSQFVAIADDTKLKSSLIDTLRHEFQSNRELAAVIEAGAAAVRQNVLGYFRQEGLFDLDHVALVDVGWKGTLQDAIYRIMSSESGCPRLTEYYFGTSAYSQDTSPLNRKIPFFLFPSGKPGYGPLVELLLLADHGMTLSYECDGQSHYRAVTKEAGAHLADWGLSDYFDGIRDFSRLFAQSLSDYGTLFELHYDGAVPFLLDRFGSAEQSAAETLGDLPYCGNQEESYLRGMAPPFSAMDALKFICLPTQGRRDMTQWLEATYARSGWSARLILHCDPRLVLSAGGKALLAPRNGGH